jgi:hypothetical protein
MITIWFLMALMTYSEENRIHYRGFGGFLDKEKCEEKSIIMENYIVDMESMRGNTVYVQTYCMEMQTFEEQFDRPKKSGDVGA